MVAMIELTGDVLDQVLNWLKSQYFKSEKISFTYSSLVCVKLLELLVRLLGDCLLFAGCPLIDACHGNARWQLVVLLDEHIQVSEGALPALLEKVYELLLRHYIVSVLIHDLK